MIRILTPLNGTIKVSVYPCVYIFLVCFLFFFFLKNPMDLTSEDFS